MQQILISLISEQTIPNIAFIKKSKEDRINFSEYWFVTTFKMEEKSCSNWI
jgi:hypothetical protein